MKDEELAEIVWRSERMDKQWKIREVESEKDFAISNINLCIIVAIVTILMLVFCLAPAEAKQKSNLTRLETCQIDYLFCAGRIVEKQAAYNAAVLMTHVCSNDTTPLAQYLDLATLPHFEVASVCQAHLGACGYYLAHWEQVLKAKYAEVRAICK